MDFASNLEPLIREVEDHVASAGWDQPVRLFALVPTANLLDANPELANELGISPEMPLTSVEQEIEDTLELDELLATIAWPEDVAERSWCLSELFCHHLRNPTCLQMMTLH